MSERRLNSFHPGDFVIIEKIATTDPKLRMRLLEMGLLKGTSLEIIRYAPLGDPIEIKLRGYRLSIRKEEAESIIVIQQS